jgi:[protein-PII] uridylyltransferase
VTSSSSDLRVFFVAGRDELLGRKPSSQPGAEWLADYTNLVDETLRRIYQAAWQVARAGFPEENDDKADGRLDHGVEMAILAIGGYGRRELCPHSDIDIAFIPGEEEHPLLDAVIKEAFRLIVEVMIDGARLDVGYAYRPISDCARLDHTAKAALLESRLVAGSERLRRRMREELHFGWDTVGFLLTQTEERRQVARRANLSLYAVEPNLKEGTGALREIHTALWVTGALHPSEEPLHDLEWRGLITHDDVHRVLEANTFFLKLRVWLHLKTGRKTDVLLVDLQDRCARDWGYTGSGARASQNLLAEYYHHAENALRFSEKVMRRLLEGPLPLDEHFVAVGQRLEAAHPYVLRNHPELLMTPFALSHKYHFPTSSNLDLLIEEALPLVNAGVRRNSIMRASFFTLLPEVENAADALTQLRGRGLLQKFIPEFDQMLHLAPADPSHELTVGEHSIYAVRQLGQLWRERNEDEFLYAVWDGVDDVEILVLATLLHDCGKIEPEGDHAISGERLVRHIAGRLELREERIVRLQLLVRRHLLLPRVARLRELSAPGTLRDVIENVGDVATLKMLYLLSLADTRAVSERAYSQSELSAMRELYERVLMAMTREEAAQVLTDSEAREEMIHRERQRLRREMRHLELSDGTLQKLCENLPASYVLNTPLPTIATHLRFLDQLPQEKLIVDFYQHPRDAFTEMTVITYDDPEPGLLSKLCAVVYALGSEIRMAQVFTISDWRGGSREQQNGSVSDESSTRLNTQAATNGAPANASSDAASYATSVVLEDATISDATTNNAPGDIVLDRLHVSRGGRPLSSSQSARLAAALREVLLDGRSVEQILEANGKSNPTGISPLKISVRNDLSDEHSVLTLVNDNVPGLMFHITRTLAALKWDIHSAKVTTWAGRAEDAFYVTQRVKAKGGTTKQQKIEDDEIKTELERLRKRLRRAG